MNGSVEGPGEDSGAGMAAGNGRYSVALTPAGGGWSRFEDYAVTVWADDPTRDADGFFIYLRDLGTGLVWSAGLQPTLRRADRYVARDGRCPSIEREDAGIRTALELSVPDGEAVELRRLTIENRSDHPRTIEVTTCVPLALDAPAAFAGHPAFSKLFIQTRYLPALQGLAARRRPRSPDDPALSAVHLLVPGGPGAGDVQYETDRALFVGRGRTLAEPRALDPGAGLSGSVGNVLDPVLCLRREVLIQPGETTSFMAVLAAGLGLAEAEAAATRHAGPAAVGIFGAADGAGGAKKGAQSGQPTADAGIEDEPLRFFNGYGGFTEAGDEYVIRLGSGPDGLRLPPLPWVNVVANEMVGFLASETGAGGTWAGNSRLNRLTPWSNDPVSDPHGEALYLRDEATGAFWSPTPGPALGVGPYETRHGFGYSLYRHSSQGLDQETCLYVAAADPVKLVRMRMSNRTDRTRRVSACAYFEWVLGGTAAETRGDIETERCQDQGLVLARNPASEDFARRVAFAAAVVDGRAPVQVRADRAAFLGRDGSVSAPAALMGRAELPGATKDPADPCAVLQAMLELSPGETVEVAFLLGQAESRQAALELVDRYRMPGAVERALDEVTASWRRRLERVSVRTPSPHMDLMVNGWLMYQNVSCRLWGRSAFYQSGGAFGFRDQLQDAMALVYVEPERTRRQILEHAAHQFPEGDVLHWWHPPASRGIRTRFADDLLWLPYVTGFYLDTTGDLGILDERAGFVLGRLLEPGEDEAYMTPTRSTETVDLYEHCARAIDRALAVGTHGLPLMGTGDWNDGMNRVGREGRGESVWLGFFLVAVLDRWIPIARGRGQEERADRWTARRESLAQALEAAGWDGAWYRRAYYDDGAPMGSSTSDECRIDAIAQAWAVLSGVAPPGRVDQALDALEDQLVSEEEGLIRLLTPPFDRTPHDPGYIKGYLPGVRENGGQYTHGALWAIRALAEAGRPDRAATLFEMLTPVARGATSDRIERYKVEPYVVAADVYGAPPHVGRGGWTWYTGSASWMWRTALESILGITLEGGERLRVGPRIPCSWPGYDLRFQVPGGTTRYEIEVVRADGDSSAPRATLDGEPLAVEGGAAVIPLASDGGAHQVRIELGTQPDASSASPLDAITSA